MTEGQLAAQGWTPHDHNGQPDWLAYHLIVRRWTGDNWHHVETREFTDKPAALAYCRSIGAAFTC